MAKEIVGSRRAAILAGVSHATVCNWIKQYGIGELRDGVMHVDRVALRRIMRAKATLKVGNE